MIDLTPSTLVCELFSAWLSSSCSCRHSRCDRKELGAALAQTAQRAKRKNRAICFNTIELAAFQHAAKHPHSQPDHNSLELNRASYCQNNQLIPSALSTGNLHATGRFRFELNLIALHEGTILLTFTPFLVNRAFSCRLSTPTPNQHNGCH